jgi:hypothetical protein
MSMLRTIPVVWIVLYARFASAGHTEATLGPIDPTISFVETGGAWDSGTRRGYYRAVVQTRCSPEHCRDRLFVQWVMERPRLGVVATRFIREVGDLTHVTKVRLVLGSGGTKLEVHHEADGSDEKWVRCLLLSVEGRYTEHEGACARRD